ncbi:hypothetical protein DL764_007769 [Monosporascus ibericus]|uniref:AB hydrolase-1 domain-containing protein n=1 Tax=Monosporascus ibericus TaxID=155417 RepID=A0A4Q4T1B6_9PEZI|nr:hypothetical protein DL764_007769 [Monosporascus ibericus]
MDHNSHHSMPSKLPPQLYITIPEFTLESGETLINAVVAFTFHGLLNARGDNAVVPFPFHVPGPADILDRTDTSAHKYVLDILGVKSVQCVIGPSMGGMVALEWSFFGTGYVRALVLIATAARQCGWQIAWNENQRNTILCDAKFRSGWYGDDPPLAGLAAARMAALMTYRSQYSFKQRFGRRTNAAPVIQAATRLITDDVQLVDGSTSPVDSDSESYIEAKNGQQDPAKGIFSAQSYLRYHGDKFNARFDANCYIHILDKMDTHDITRGRYASDVPEDEALERALGRIRQPTLVVGIPSDGLYPIQEQQTLYEAMPNAVLGIIESLEGHDAFLIETAQLNDLVRTFFDRRTVLELEDKAQACLDIKRDAIIFWAGSF